MAKVIRKRFHWLAKLINDNKLKVGAEVGCMTGNTSAYLLRNCPKLHLICVDLWKYDSTVMSEKINKFQDWDFDIIRKKFSKRTANYRNRMSILQGVSWEMAGKIEDNSLDFVFVDADHCYQSVSKDIIAWVSKLKLGGILCGHDINLEGVEQACNVLLNDYQYAMDNVWYTLKENYVGKTVDIGV